MHKRCSIQKGRPGVNSGPSFMHFNYWKTQIRFSDKTASGINRGQEVKGASALPTLPAVNALID